MGVVKSNESNFRRDVANFFHVVTSCAWSEVARRVLTMLQRCNRTLLLVLCYHRTIKMKIFSLAVALFVASYVSVGNAWSTKPGLFPRRAHVAPSSFRTSLVSRAASAAAATPEGDSASSKQLTHAEAKKEERRKKIKKEGGPFAFNTKYGALNPFAIYYGLTSIILGLPWLAALTFCQVLYIVTGNRVDKYVSTR